ncbi:MAG: ATP-binding cassette domain-containing protein [Acidimicrobiia bacterium]
MRIEVTGISKRFGTAVAADDLSFSVRPGAVTGFVGPNGAGKSTTMRVMLALDRADAGRATFDGRPYRELREPMRAVGALLDAKAVHPRRSARNHLRMFAATNRIPDARVDEVLGLVGLGDVATRRAGGFSLGMGQRLGLALALLGDPPVLILDEPANGLDPEGIIWIRSFMRYLADQGRTVFVSSHVLSELGQVVDELIVIGKGRLLASGSLHDVLGTGERVAVTVVSPDAARLAELVRAHGATVETGDGNRIDVTGLDAPAVGEIAAANAIALHELTPREPSLEDAFLRLTSDTQEFRAGETGS